MIENSAYHPAVAAGRNQTITRRISADGSPELQRTYRIAARTGRAVRLCQGQQLTIVNPTGHQVCDFWAFCASNLSEYLSMSHNHTALTSLFPKTGDTLVSNARRAMLYFAEDTSPGRHDTVVAACDIYRYRQLGVQDYHDNCTDNLRMSMSAIGLTISVVPSPFNLWMNIPITGDGGLSWEAPVSQPGDRVRFTALMDCIAVMSACPQDMTPVNGVGCLSADLHFRVEPGPGE